MRRALPAMLVAIFLTGGSGSSQAQSPPGNPQKWAVVVGVGLYKDTTIRRLNYTVADAKAVYDFLVDARGGGFPKDNVRLLLDRDATQRSVRSALGTWLARRAVRGDMVFIYYAAHGAPEVDYSNREPDGFTKFLVPYDAEASDLYATAINMTEVETFLSRIKAETVVLVLDTCYSGAAGGRAFANLPQGRSRDIKLQGDFLNRLAQGKGRAVLTAADTNELALELPELRHGIFTYYFLEALRGKADSRGVGYVTPQDAYQYLYDRVVRHSRQAGGNQNPKLTAQAVGEIILAGRPRSPSVSGGAASAEPKITLLPRTASLVIRSPVERVEVWLGDKRLGEVDPAVDMLVEELAAGTHRIRAQTRKPAFAPWEGEVQLAAGRRAEILVDLKPIRPAPAPPAPSLSKPREGWAAIIGINRYQQIPPLRYYAVRDAEAMYRVFTGTVGFKREQVLLLTDNTERKPTLRNIHWALGSFLARNAKVEDTALIFFGGHGAFGPDLRRTEPDGRAAYLIPTDANPKDLEATALAMDEFATIFSRIQANRVVAFIDAPFFDYSPITRSIETNFSLKDKLDRLTRAQGRGIMTAARPSERVLEDPGLGHGLFTYYVVEGLNGAADRNRDGIVTLDELYEYVSREVSRKARSLGTSQTPQLSAFSSEGPLPLAVVSSR